MTKAPAICQWISLKQALTAFAENVSGHQGSGHIKPLHWYVSCRLVVEGGFHPDDITPHPPFVVSDRAGRHVLQHVPNKGASGERTILGGLKTKDVDVHDVMARLADRDDVRSATTRYEAVALALVNPYPPQVGEIIETFPPAGSPLSIRDFFGKLYRQYDQRFVYAAPRLAPVTRRLSWDPDSPALNENRILEYEPRIGYPEEDSFSSE